MSSYGQLISELADADRRDPVDVAERDEWVIETLRSGQHIIVRREEIPAEHDPFERDQTYKED